jgi:hypothetical protein
MKFDKQVMSFLALLCSFTLNADAFTPQTRKSSGLAVFGARKGPSTRQAMVTRLYAAEDDEDDDDETSLGPLGKGIDSVSWLPSVVGEKGEPIAGAKEVSRL